MSFTVVNPTPAAPQLAPFADSLALAYCRTLSQALLQEPSARHYSDLIALGYWLRPANIERILRPYKTLKLRPLGHLFHAAPGNVDSLFVYSGILSMLCGNVNTIRLSNKAGGSAALLCELLKELAIQHPEVSARLQIIRCHRDAPELISLQRKIDGRVLWGSEQGIQALRQRPMPAHARELTFANKLSLAVIDTQALLDAEPKELQQLVSNFARDNLTFAQQACSSAKVLIWHDKNNQHQQAQGIFWPALSAYLASPSGAEKYALSESEQYRALHNAQSMAMAATVHDIKIVEHYIRAAGSDLTPALLDAHQGCGLFVELQIRQLSELTPRLTAGHQTLSYWGLSEAEVTGWLSHCLVGIDRVVPIGTALDFNTVWDGVDLVRAFSRDVACNNDVT